MAQIELELDAGTGTHADISAIDKFYESNLDSIVKLDSPSSSLRTCSSKSLKSIANRCGADSGESTCASDSESEGLELNAVRLKEQFLKYQTYSSQPISQNRLLSKNGDLIVTHNADKTVASGTQIDSIAIQNSTDIQFGNKTFYNGPVFIYKQFVKDVDEKWICAESSGENLQTDSGVENKAFDGKLRSIKSYFNKRFIIVNASQTNWHTK